MRRESVRVLISGASVAGPTAAYWLCRQGFAVTVVERMPLARVRTSGHAVDLFGPAMDVAEWTGVLPAVMAARTQTEVVSFQRAHGRAVDIDMRQLVAGISGRHVEVMRGALAAALHESTRDDAEYRFEDSIRTIEQEPDGVAVTFEHGSAARFDLVIGADGLHSIVRRVHGRHGGSPNPVGPAAGSCSRSRTPEARNAAIQEASRCDNRRRMRTPDRRDRRRRPARPRDQSIDAREPRLR